MSNYLFSIPAHRISGKFIIGFCCCLPLNSQGQQYLCTENISVNTVHYKKISGYGVSIVTDDEYLEINTQENLKAEIKTRARVNTYRRTHLVDSEKGLEVGPEFRGECVTAEGMDNDDKYFNVLRCNAFSSIRDDPIIHSFFIDKTDLTFVLHYSEPFMSQTSHGTCEITR